MNRETNGGTTLKRLKIALLFLVLITIGILVIVFKQQVGEIIDNYLEWVFLNPVLGMLTYIIVYTLATVAVIPGSILTLGAGFIYALTFGIGLGIFLGSLVVFVGASIGAIGAFLLGRTVLRESVASWVDKYPKFKVIDNVMGEQGFKLVFLLRLSPLIPFNAFNYMMGITSVTLKDYSLGMLGVIPGTIAYVTLGSSASSLASLDSVSSNIGILIFSIVGTILALAISIYISIKAKKAIDEILDYKDEILEIVTDSK